MQGTPVFYGPSIEGWAQSHDPAAMADALLEVERDAARVRERARAARSHIADTYSLDAMLHHHEEVYRSLMRA